MGVAVEVKRKLYVRNRRQGRRNCGREQRQEAGNKLRVTIMSPGFVRTNFTEGVTNPEVKAQLAASRDKFAIPPDAIARAIAFAIEQPADVDVNEIVIRPTAQV